MAEASALKINLEERVCASLWVREVMLFPPANEKPLGCGIVMD